MKRSRNGFSLIELLAVIAVIAILAGLTMAIYGKVVTSRQKTQCAMNLRQMGNAMALYSIEHNNIIVPGVLAGQTGTWEDGLAPYVDLKKAAPNGVGVRPSSVFACPASDHLISGGWKSDYGKNDYINGSGDDENLLRITMFVDPASIIAIADGKHRDLGTQGTTRGPDARHGTQANFLFMDGHVESLVPSSLESNYREPPWYPELD